jgi:hypothetical protein
MIHVLLTRTPLYSQDCSCFLVRLACVKRAASVDSEPGSNSRLNLLITQELFWNRTRGARPPCHRFVSCFGLKLRLLTILLLETNHDEHRLKPVPPRSISHPTRLSKICAPATSDLVKGKPTGCRPRKPFRMQKRAGRDHNPENLDSQKAWGSERTSSERAVQT